MTTYIASDNTDLQTLIDEAARTASEEHRAEIIFPPGTWLTGPLTLYSHMTLTLEEGATIRFIADPQLYPPVWTRWEGIESVSYTHLTLPTN